MVFLSASTGQRGMRFLQNADGLVQGNGRICPGRPFVRLDGLCRLPEFFPPPQQLGIVHPGTVVLPFQCHLLHVEQPMKMIGHQAINYHVTEWQQVCPYFPQEELVVFVGEKHLLPFVALVVDMEKLLWVEVHCFLIEVVR